MSYIVELLCHHQVWFWVEMLDGSSWKCHAWSWVQMCLPNKKPQEVLQLLFFNNFFLISVFGFKPSKPLQLSSSCAEDISLSFRRPTPSPMPGGANGPPAKRQRQLGCWNCQSRIRCFWVPPFWHGNMQTWVRVFEKIVYSKRPPLNSSQQSCFCHTKRPAVVPRTDAGAGWDSHSSFTGCLVKIICADAKKWE